MQCGILTDQVQGQGVGVHQAGADQCLSVATIVAGTFDLRGIAPVRPEQHTGRRRKKLPVDQLRSLSA